MYTKKALGGMAVAACALFAGTAVAGVGDCQIMNGYAYGFLAGGVPVPATADSTWTKVRANSAGFSGRTIGATTSCAVKNVESPKDAKKPTITYITVENSQNITQDECSMYNSISQIHSQLGNAKIGDAYLSNRALMTKAQSLYDTSKLSFAAKEAIVGAAANVDACIYPMLPQ